MNIKDISAGKLKLKLYEKEIPVSDAALAMLKLIKTYSNNFLFESKDVSHVYGRLSLIGIEGVINIRGKENDFSIKALNKRGQKYLDKINLKELIGKKDSIAVKNNEIKGTIVNKDASSFEETERSKKKNIAQVIRKILETFKVKEKIAEHNFLGLYGAFSYDFIRLFEDIGNKNKKAETPDYNLFLADTFIFFDHLMKKAKILCYRETAEEAEQAVHEIELKLLSKAPKVKESKIKNPKFDMSKESYMALVKISRKYIVEGEIFEVVMSNRLVAEFSGDPFDVYLKYREANPSPYLFYFDFGNEQLVGASPEMMVRCENGIVNLRPISGTAPRGKDPIEDHENMLELLKSKKERAELDMLVDLGRNDLSRVCEPGITISDYRFVEKYSKVMHTVSHISGKLRPEYTAYDALIACLNNGTLTGAPKVAAMKIIENHEPNRREYYGGAIGYLTFDGDMDTGIIIRTSHIKDKKITYRSGASIVYDSMPEPEYKEIINKAKAFLGVFSIDKDYD